MHFRQGLFQDEGDRNRHLLRSKAQQRRHGPRSRQRGGRWLHPPCLGRSQAMPAAGGRTWGAASRGERPRGKAPSPHSLRGGDQARPEKHAGGRTERCGSAAVTFQTAQRSVSARQDRRRGTAGVPTAPRRRGEELAAVGTPRSL